MFKDMEKWVEIRRRVLSKEISKRQACRNHNFRRQTLWLVRECNTGDDTIGQSSTGTAES